MQTQTIKRKIGICRICRNSAKNIAITAREMFMGTRDPFDYFLCSKCGSLSIAEIPGNIGAYYNKYYAFAEKHAPSNFIQKIVKNCLISSASPLVYKILSPFLKKQSDLRIKALFPYNISKNAKILDVGCGGGGFLQELEELGFRNLLGIDPFLRKDIHLSKSLHLLKKDFLDVSEKFSLITFHHSFEHIPTPQEILNHIHRLLLPDGIAILRFPNVESYSFRKFREHWEGIHAPFHFILPSFEGMELMLKNAGLRMLEKRGEQMLSLFLNSIAHSLDVCDYESLGFRTYLEKYSLRKVMPPLTTKNEISTLKQRCKQVMKYGISDWIVYYLALEKSNKRLA